MCCSQKVHFLYKAAPTPRKVPRRDPKKQPRWSCAFFDRQDTLQAADIVSVQLKCPVEWLIGSGRIGTPIKWLFWLTTFYQLLSQSKGRRAQVGAEKNRKLYIFFLYFLHTICTFFIIVLENKRKIILISPICLSSSVILLLVCDLLSQRMLNYLFVIPEMRNVGNSSSLNSGGRFQHFI